jgi:hypothetical protein
VFPEKGDRRWKQKSALSAKSSCPMGLGRCMLKKMVQLYISVVVDVKKIQLNLGEHLGR